MALQPLFAYPWQWRLYNLMGKSVLFLAGSIDVEVEVGPSGSHVTPVMSVKQQSPHATLPWLPISANMWPDWNVQSQVSLAGPEAKALSCP